MRVQPPTNGALRTVYLDGFMQALPRIASLTASASDAYVYLAESIRAWPDQAGLAELIAEAGWQPRSGATSPAASSRCTAPPPDLPEPRRHLGHAVRGLNPQVSDRARDGPDPDVTHAASES